MKRIFILFILSLSVVYSQTDTTLLSIVEQMPKWHTCTEENVNEDDCTTKEILNFISKNIQYPTMAMEAQGTVYVEFIIEKDGSISNVKSLRSPSSEFENEAIRVVKLMPKFIPAKQSGKPVRIRYRLPIRFKVE